MGDHESSNYGGLTPAATEKVVVEEVLLPGFRFHPTDEELVAFYLKRKIQQRPLSIELIRQLDIYKYDPWDLPKLATTGEKELYFYCPRDRKYRNSARPNRVTRAGFWKATGTDRPIYSSQGSSSKCIGLKKSLVFYKGRAAKGIKTDWMMHEFRLPTLADSANKRFLEKNHISANDSWAICRIFKKTNPTSQRALSHSWVVSPFTEDTISHHDTPTQSQRAHQHYQYHPQMGSSETTMQYFCGNGGDKDLKQQSTTCNTFCSLDCSPCKPSNHHLPISAIGDLFSPFFGVSGSGSAKAGTGAAAADVPSLLSNMSSPLGLLGEFGKAFHGTGTVSVDDVALLQEMQDQNMRNQLISTNANANANGLWGTLPFINGFPWSLPLTDTAADYSAWKSNAVWDHESSTQ